ncbi:DUF5655 domain-containing protein [Bradyrhizobium sp. CCBAU 45389]|uniref:DUF5655 domain-containing protein n=1 Tax=Bradyrhizobium sp. CCBAU 45389 TaxID=858429 RepID=UPI00230524A5|nr:DUF5655 domain-containing protein [Bradyrhizobium sp. CCBAU 45389]
MAEDITSRFFNVISLFNGTIPFIALQMQALRVGDHNTIVFTKVIDVLKRGLEEGPPPPPTDRAYWEHKGSAATVQLADELLKIAKEFDATLQLSYNKHYIGIFQNGQPLNFCRFAPKKNTMNLAIRLERSDEIDSQIEQAGIEKLSHAQDGAYRLSLQKHDVAKHRDYLKALMKAAYDTFIA